MKKPVYTIYISSDAGLSPIVFILVSLFKKHKLLFHMKKFTLLCALLVTYFAAHAQLKLGNNVNTINSSAILEMEATNKGMLLPRLTTANLPAANASNEGMMVYDTDANCIKYCDGAQWICSSSSASSEVSFSGRRTSGNAIAGTTTLHAMDVEYFDIGNNLSGTFTAPVAGRYYFTGHSHASGNPGGSFYAAILKNGVLVHHGSRAGITGTSGEMSVVSCVLDLVAGDVVGLGVWSQNTVPTALNDFSGFLISGSGGGGAADGNGIYDGSGTTPAGTAVTLTDNLNFDANTLFIDGTNNRVGVGTASPVDKLEVAGGIHTSSNALISKASEAYFDFFAGGNRGRIVAFGPDNSTAANFQITGNSTNSSVARNYFYGVGSNGFVGINTLSPDQNLSVGGNASKSAGGTAWAVFSDPRIKKNMQPMQLGLATLEKINPVFFQYDESKVDDVNESVLNKTYIGVNAEEIYNIPELRDYLIEIKEKYGIKDLKQYVNSDALMYITINAVKELKSDLTNLKAENTALKAQLAEMQTLKAEVASIKAMLGNASSLQQNAASTTGKE